MSHPVTSEVRVRPMLRADIDEVVRLHMVCFPDYFTTHMGREFVRRLYISFLEKPGFPFVAVEGDAIVGFVVGVTRSRAVYTRFYRANLAFVVCTTVIRLLSDRVVREGLWRRLDQHVRIALSLLNPRSGKPAAPKRLSRRAVKLDAARRGVGGALMQAVAPDRRGRGIAEMYMAALFQAFRQEGIREVHGTVLRDNIAARRSLEKNGWVLMHEDGNGCVYSRPISQ